MKVEELAFTRKMDPCLYDEEAAWSKNRKKDGIVAIKAIPGGLKDKIKEGRELID